MKRQLIAAAAVVVTAGMAAQAFSQPNPNQLINNRKGAMALQGKYFAPILAMAQGRMPYDAKIVQRNADYLAVLSQLPWDDFQQHSLGLKNTRAKEEIILDEAKFKSRVEQLQSEIQKLQTAAKSGDQNGVRTAASAVGKTCNSCHEDFSSFDFRFKL